MTKKLNFSEGIFIDLNKMPELSWHLDFMAKYHKTSKENYIKKLIFDDVIALRNAKKPLLERAISELNKQVSKYIG